MDTETKIPYAQWSPERLADRVLALERQLKDLQDKHTTSSLPASTTPQRPQGREIDPSKYTTRFIALKFAYLGQKYNGFEYSPNNRTPLPTVEEVVWRALMKARLIFPRTATGENDELDWEDCQYSKCGRTDRGVSAFGQVIGLRVRSNQPRAKPTSRVDEPPKLEDAFQSCEVEGAAIIGLGDVPLLVPSNDEALDETADFHHIRDEIQYPQVLNRLLPPDIRVLAWCPTPPAGFSARFSCRERQYRYFFTQPAFNPTPGTPGTQIDHIRDSPGKPSRREGWLDIEAMQEAASKYIGLHDFRNLCKVDASKQISDFTRRIFHSEIREVDATAVPAAYVSTRGFSEFDDNACVEDASLMQSSTAPKIYVFILHGSAFLWHQVRHMVAVLFLIGQGLEHPDLVNKLLDINMEPRRPLYEMADDAPLVLWDCIFPRAGDESREDALEWVPVGDEDTSPLSAPSVAGTKATGKFGSGGTVDTAWKIWRQAKIDEILAGSLLDLTVRLGDAENLTMYGRSSSRKVYYGGNAARTEGKYMHVLDRRRLDTVESVNQRYALKKGLPPKTSSMVNNIPRDERRDHIK